MKWNVTRVTFTAKVRKLLYEVSYHIGQKTPILKGGVLSQNFVIFYLMFFLTSYLQRWSMGSVPSSLNNQNAKILFCSESAAFYIRNFYRRKLLFK